MRGVDETAVKDMESCFWNLSKFVSFDFYTILIGDHAAYLRAIAWRSMTLSRSKGFLFAAI
jgi:hypothetical protein